MLWVQDIVMPTVVPAFQLRAGVDYPRNYAELRAWFPDDAACLDYLEWLRWPDGFVCPRCETAGHWRMGDGRFWCAHCQQRISVTAGTIFHATRTPPDGVVRRCLVRDFREEWRLGQNFA